MNCPAVSRWVLCALAALGALPALAQGDGQGSTAYHLLLRQPSTASARGAAAAPRLTLVSRRALRDAAPLARDPRLSESMLVVVARDIREREIARVALPDPRILRAEFPDAAGQLQGRLLQHADAELFATLPDDPRTALLDVLQPRWNGHAFELVPLGVVVVPEDAR